ncbi:hypothetical protein [Aeromonas caviae]|uniref:hypothetical protein n=1 Tax=Aeromonas caviae TaxID=648 RepID=UPI002B4875BC|nr:hypothetical protein [Aeromonas caviae]
MNNSEIRFIKPCLFKNEAERELTVKYSWDLLSEGKIAQINLDNCSLQRMERLPLNPTIDDVEKVGLLPLVNLLQSGNFSLAAIGMNEMPDRHVENCYVAYESFCKKFWPAHKDDVEATHREYDSNSTDKKMKFRKLPDNARCTYGPFYVSMMQIQNIKINYKDIPAEQQFAIYLHSIISLLNIVSAYEIELAKYAFWDVSPKELNKLPANIIKRKADILDNFARIKSSLDKCQDFCFDAAMDIYWLNGSNLSENLNHTISVNGKRYKVDNWVGTNDHKLYRISKDIHSVYEDGLTMKSLEITRESEMANTRYWSQVDRTYNDIMIYRNKNNVANCDDLLSKIDRAIDHIEKEILAGLNTRTKT